MLRVENISQAAAQAARRALRPRRRRRLRPALRGGRVRQAAGVHRSGGAALLARRGDPARQEPRPRRGRGLSRSSTRRAPRAIADGYGLLHELGAVDDEKNLTDVGRELARLPLDPRVARMLVAARAEGCLEQMLVIAAALSVQDPRERPLERAAAADERHARFADEQLGFPLATSSCGSCSRARWRSPAARTSSPFRACASGATSTRSCSTTLDELEWKFSSVQPGEAGGLPRHPPRAARRPARQRRHARRGRRQLHRRARHQVLGASGLVDEEGRALDHGRRAGRDDAPVRALRRRHRPEVAGGARRAPAQARPAASRTGKRAAARWSRSSAARSTACRSTPTAACTTGRSTRSSRARSSSARRWWRATSTRARRSSRTTGASPPTSSASSTSRAARTSWSTTS